MEIKSRYIAQNQPYLNTKSINRLLENPADIDVEKYGIFRIFNSVLGINLAVILSLADALNAICMHCLVLKWFFEIIFEPLFHLQSTTSIELCDAANRTTPYTTGHVSLVTVLIETSTHLVYFIFIKLFSGDCFSRLRSFIDSLDDGRSRYINVILYYTSFLVVSITLLYLSVSASWFKLKIECESFFKDTASSHSVRTPVLVI